MLEEVGLTITCPQCQKQYRYDEARFGGDERKRVRCPNCQAVFEIDNPHVEEALDATFADGMGTVGPAAPAQPEKPELPELAPLPRNVRFSLAVISGAQAGGILPINKPRVYIGRGSTMEIQLKDAEVSRRHAMLEIRDEHVLLTDLGSTNGSFVNSERIQAVELNNQTEFSLGSTTMMLIVTRSQ